MAAPQLYEQGGWFAATKGCFFGLGFGALVYPLDSAKTHLQLQDAKDPLFRNARDVWRRLIRLENLKKEDMPRLTQMLKGQGLRGLYTGFFPVGLERVVAPYALFAGYTAVTHPFRDKDGKVGRGAQVVGGFAGGLLEGALVSAPAQTLKTKMLKDTQRPVRQLHWFVEAAPAVAKKEGIRGFYQGVASTAAIRGIHGAMFFPMTEVLRRAYAAGDEKRYWSLQTLFLAGATAGAISTMLTQPLDFIKTRQQTFRAGLSRLTVAQAAKEIIAAHGMKGLFTVGLGLRLVAQVIPTAVMTGLYYPFSEWYIENKYCVLPPNQDPRLWTAETYRKIKYDIWGFPIPYEKYDKIWPTDPNKPTFGYYPKHGVPECLKDVPLPQYGVDHVPGTYKWPAWDNPNPVYAPSDYEPPVPRPTYKLNQE